MTSVNVQSTKHIEYDPACSACWLGHDHTQAEHEYTRTTCTAWACGAPHPKTDHMSLREAIYWRNTEAAKRIGGSIEVHWGFIHGADNRFIQGIPLAHNYVFAVIR